MANDFLTGYNQIMGSAGSNARDLAYQAKYESDLEKNTQAQQQTHTVNIANQISQIVGGYAKMHPGVNSREALQNIMDDPKDRYHGELNQLVSDLATNSPDYRKYILDDPTRQEIDRIDRDDPIKSADWHPGSNGRHSFYTVSLNPNERSWMDAIKGALPLSEGAGTDDPVVTYNASHVLDGIQSLLRSRGVEDNEAAERLHNAGVKAFKLTPEASLPPSLDTIQSAMRNYRRNQDTPAYTPVVNSAQPMYPTATGRPNRTGSGSDGSSDGGGLAKTQNPADAKTLDTYRITDADSLTDVTQKINMGEELLKQYKEDNRQVPGDLYNIIARNSANKGALQWQRVAKSFEGKLDDFRSVGGFGKALMAFLTPGYGDIEYWGSAHGVSNMIDKFPDWYDTWRSEPGIVRGLMASLGFRNSRKFAKENPAFLNNIHIDQITGEIHVIDGDSPAELRKKRLNFNPLKHAVGEPIWTQNYAAEHPAEFQFLIQQIEKRDLEDRMFMKLKKLNDAEKLTPEQQKQFDYLNTQDSAIKTMPDIESKLEVSIPGVPGNMTFTENQEGEKPTPNEGGTPVESTTDWVENQIPFDLGWGDIELKPFVERLKKFPVWDPINDYLKQYHRSDITVQQLIDGLAKKGTDISKYFSDTLDKHVNVYEVDSKTNTLEHVKAAQEKAAAEKAQVEETRIREALINQIKKNQKNQKVLNSGK